MKLESRDIIQASIEEVYTLLRDRLDQLVPYLPNVGRISVMERKDTHTGPYVINQWHAKVEIPDVAKKFIKPELLSWKDLAQWNDSLRHVDYRLESFVANDLFKAQGRNSFAAKGDKQTELSMTCQVDIYPEKLPGVPRLLAATVKRPVEDFIKKMLEPNITSLSKGLNEYFRVRS